MNTEEKAKLLETLSLIVDRVRNCTVIRIDLEAGKVQLSTTSTTTAAVTLKGLLEREYSYSQLSNTTFELTQLPCRNFSLNLSVHKLNLPLAIKKTLINHFGTVYNGSRRVDLPVKDLIKLTAEQLRYANGIGPVSVYKIIVALSDYNLSLAKG